MLIKPIYFEPALHLYRLLNNLDYRSWCYQSFKFGKKNRFKKYKTKIHNWNIEFPDAASFLSSYKEIFVHKIYKFSAKNSTPRILDLGGNIGLSVLFFKNIYPQSLITVFEADPSIFNYLKNNLYGNGYKDVELINKAAWDSNDILQFNAEGGDGGCITEAPQNAIQVEAVDLNQFLENNCYDFLKMDIEGAECKVIPSIKDKLHNFSYVFIEYHSRIDEPQNLHEIIGALTHAGFRIDVHNIMSSYQPFLPKTNNSSFDLQLNIFATKAQ